MLKRFHSLHPLVSFQDQTRLQSQRLCFVTSRIFTPDLRSSTFQLPLTARVIGLTQTSDKTFFLGRLHISSAPRCSGTTRNVVCVSMLRYWGWQHRSFRRRLHLFLFKLNGDGNREVGSLSVRWPGLVMHSWRRCAGHTVHLRRLRDSGIGVGRVQLGLMDFGDQ